MANKQYKNRKCRRNERGVALLFAIGLLSLMIMLGVSFSMESLQSQKAASNNSSRSAAKSLAQSAIRNISSTVLYYCDQCWDSADVGGKCANNSFITDLSFLGKNDSAIADDKARISAVDMLDELLEPESVFVSDYVTSKYKTRYDISVPGDKVRWNYVYDKVGDDKPIVGRFAYRILPPASTTQVNLAYFLSAKQDPSEAPTLPFDNKDNIIL